MATVGLPQVPAYSPPQDLAWLKVESPHSEGALDHSDSDETLPASPQAIFYKTAPKKSLKKLSSAEKQASHHAIVDFHFTKLNGAHDCFALGDHECDLLADALKASKEGTKLKPFISNFTPLHYACQKHNEKMCEFLLDSPECRNFANWVHVVDDFDKKPIDHLCNHKGQVPAKIQHLAQYIEKKMKGIKADPKDKREILYQDIKLNGPLEKRQKPKSGGIIDTSRMVDASGKAIQIAQGETGPDLTNIMTAYEVEALLPADMKKNFKIVAKSGFDNFVGSWTKGESPLHWAASRGKVDVCRMLVISLNGDPESMEDDKGRTPIAIAKAKKHHALAKMLHTKDFPIERDAELKKAKDVSRSSKGRGAAAAEAERVRAETEKALADHVNKPLNKKRTAAQKKRENVEDAHNMGMSPTMRALDSPKPSKSAKNPKIDIDELELNIVEG